MAASKQLINSPCPSFAEKPLLTQRSMKLSANPFTVPVVALKCTAILLPVASICAAVQLDPHLFAPMAVAVLSTPENSMKIGET